MAIGMFVHRLAPPRPPPPAFSRTIPTAISSTHGNITIQFYVPKSYNLQRRLREHKFPVVVNFHGGGFTIGTGTDDARWASAVVEQVGAVVASVDYRLAPEHPFPTGVEDGVDALVYLSKHADELCLDPDRIAISGFSAGGNMAFTVPLRLQQELDSSSSARSSSSFENTQPFSDSATQSMLGSDPSLKPSRHGSADFPAVRVAAIVAWYPPTDYTLTRPQRRSRMGPRVDKALPALLTNLFDEAYIQPPSMDKSHPCLSPGLAPHGMLAAALPEDILMYTCEWDMLRAEAQDFRQTLEGLGKRVVYRMVPEVSHGWDKTPNPISVTPKVREHYEHACGELRRIFYPSGYDAAAVRVVG